MYKTGEKEFKYVKRVPIDKITRSKILDIVDPALAKCIDDQLGNQKILDWNGNPIRHVRINTKAGKQVKARVDFKSEKEYKNFYYAESGSVPYGVILFQPDSDQRELIKIHAYQIAEVFREKRKFDIDYFLTKFYPEKSNCKKYC